MRKKKSTQQLVGIESVTDSSVLTAGGELTFYLVQPTNLNVLPESGVRTRVTALLNVLKTSAEMELLALDSKESYQDNRLYYRRRAEEEGNPAIRALLAQDRRHLDDVQTMMASSRQFCFVLRRRMTDGAIDLTTVGSSSGTAASPCCVPRTEVAGAVGDLLRTGRHPRGV